MLAMEIKTAPHITVVVPCYNYGHFLSRALQSVYDQTFEQWECIIVDDGSKDNTGEVAKKWVNKDPRFIYIRQDNGGLSSARNTGVKHANGKYIQFLDADDTIHPDKCSIQFKLLESTTQDAVVYSSFEFEDEHQKKHHPEPAHYLVPRKNILAALITEWEYGFIMPIHCFLFRKKDLETIQGFYASIPTHEDLDLHLRLALRGVQFIHHPDRLCVYHVHSTSMSRNYTRMQLGYLMALGRAFHFSNNVSVQSTLLMRFGMEVAQSFIHWIRIRKINLIEVLFKNKYPFMTLLSVLFLPIFILLKVLRRFA